MIAMLNTYQNDLHPAIMPDRVPFEMLTPGWYILFGILILLAFIMVVVQVRYWWKRKYRRDANKILTSDIKPLLLSPAQRRMGLSKLSVLLKRVAIQSYSREKVAELYGVSWIKFLSSTCRGVDFTNLQTVNLIDSQYQSNEKLESIETRELDQLIRYAKKWIGGHRV